MALFKRRRRTEDEVEIPTASMADIAFLLIIFFMTTSIFARDKGLKLVLPEKTQQVVKLTSKNLLKISINDQGEVFVGDQKVNTLDEMQALVEQKLQENPKMVVLLKPHVHAPYHKMIEVFDRLKKMKVTRLALSVIKPEGGA